MIRKLLFKTNNIARSSYFWNATAGGLNAIQSVIILMVTNRVLDETASGIFSIAWSAVYLAYTLARFGMRNYQVTDANSQFSIDEYFCSRIITTLFMLIMGGAYIIYGRCLLHYSSYKCIIVLLICIWKIIDSFEDVLHAWFQKEGRLDVAGKAMTLRYLAGLISIIATLIISKDMVISIVSCIVFSFIALYLFTIRIVDAFGQVNVILPNKRIIHLLHLCLPLCAAEFLSIYLGNAPKFAIDACLTEEMQAYFNFIFMPVFAISLLASFIYNPIVASLGEAWANREYATIKKAIIQQSLVVVLITLMVIAAGYSVGVQVLGFIYNAELSDYRLELCILLLGGGMMAFSGLFTVIMVTIRKQKKIVIGYGISSIVALTLSTYCVNNYGLLGASVLYLVTTVVLVLVLAILVMRAMRSESEA